ncbi:MAG: hypothetical protein GTO45_30545 [Candidatus Aminicenantes bacterium]|nr:hypothetical protein [Candidatus Aminicenantes bacterium]NIM83132.1 hypothetical protein [Candidatus Aminicenantes bacterium]NIN22512.1 hypothetical protein [Candidatus Aminicenantes bacterium]NIN46280.1 hypothetical protein [Candidatus Aminicenantes bacterium]NIN89118.1 hypothetical protein [Candidatus Aminicenantes bacterium]
MAKEISITIENKLVREKRGMNVYHHFTRSAHIINHNDSITFPLMSSIDDDYLHISLVSGPGYLENKSVVNLPSWADFEFSFEGNVTLAHSFDRTLLKIPPGIPVWQLKVTRSSSCIDQWPDRVTIGDDQLEYQ